MTKQEFEAEVLSVFKGESVRFSPADDEAWRDAYVGGMFVLHRGKRARPPGWHVGRFDASATPTLREAVALYRRTQEHARDRAIETIAALDAAEVKP